MAHANRKKQLKEQISMLAPRGIFSARKWAGSCCSQCGFKKFACFFDAKASTGER
ncbi:hypothetical protein [Cytobacillus horneckiae]|uniref:hypothetical protein n=1 Tax=Cytobacillus horneckiae TaxID=549687 RepID=UPI003D9A9D04